MNSDKTISKFMNDVIRARAEAFRQNIKANAVLINKNLVKIPELYHIPLLGAGVVPPMICGLGVYDAGELLPEDYAFAVTYIGTVEETEKIIKERDEYKHRAEVAELALREAYEIIVGEFGGNNVSDEVADALRQAEKELEEEENGRTD